MNDYKATPAGRAAAQKYSDILDKQRPEPSYKHPRMSLQNRAKIFSPFAALRGYDEEIRAEQLSLRKRTKPELSEEDKDTLARKLLQLSKGMTVTVRYFEATGPDSFPGLCQTITAAVGSVDPVHSRLRLYTGRDSAFGKELPIVISFGDILDLSGDDISDISPDAE